MLANSYCMKLVCVQNKTGDFLAMFLIVSPLSSLQSNIIRPADAGEAY